MAQGFYNSFAHNQLPFPSLLATTNRQSLYCGLNFALITQNIYVEFPKPILQNVTFINMVYGDVIS